MKSIGALINYLKKIGRSIGFTDTEGKIILFLLVTFFIGLSIHVLKQQSEKADSVVYDYAKQDSIFNSIGNDGIDEEERQKNVEKDIASQQELLDFRNDKLKNEYTAQDASKAEKININTADVNVLTSLPGIGVKTAQNIIDYRQKIKKFKSIDELLEVKGIGSSKFERVRKLITVK